MKDMKTNRKWVKPIGLIALCAVILFGDVFAGESSSLGGTSDYTIVHDNTKEGIYQYQLDVNDIANADRLVTVYKISKYDKKAPTGGIISGSTNITNMKYISTFADVTDFNVD